MHLAVVIYLYLCNHAIVTVHVGLVVPVAEQQLCSHAIETEPLLGGPRETLLGALQAYLVASLVASPEVA